MNQLDTANIRKIVGRFPTTRDEDWKYTDLGPARDISLRWLDAGATDPGSSVDLDVAALISEIDAHWFVIANGTLTRRPDVTGITISPLATTDRNDDALAEFNAALLREGVRIQVSGTLDKPLALLFIDAADTLAVSQARVELALAPQSDLDLVEYHVSQGHAEHFANTMLRIDVADHARLRHVRIQARDLSHIQTGATAITLGRDSSLNMTGFDLGGRLIRNDLDIELGQKGAAAAFDGLYLAGDGQHIDNHTRVDHRVGPAVSRQEYRGILNGRCRCVWNGKVIVHEGADGTDGDQANHNLVLSEKAEIDTKPELEIYADDVKCSHGTTVGQLDETALFYLRSRGLDRRHATQVLTHAFAAGLVSRIPVAAAVPLVEKLVVARLADLIDDPVRNDVIV